MSEQIYFQYICRKENLVKCHIMLLSLSRKPYQLVKIDQNLTDFHIMTGSCSGMVLNWNGQEVSHPVACAKLIARKSGMFNAIIGTDLEAQIDEIAHLTINYFNMEVISFALKY